MNTRIVLKIALALSLLTSIPLFAQGGGGVAPGFDTWQTIGGGATAMKFDSSPIPAGFFCEDSQAFTGEIDFEGEPIATDPTGALGKTDTLIERLDFGSFNDQGIASSRMIVRALHLKSRLPIENECGVWDLTVGLAKNQPTTEIVFHREGENFGNFSADLVLNLMMKFTLRDDQQVTRVLERTVHFSKFNQIPFTIVENEITRLNKREPLTSIRVDTNADGIPDMLLNSAQYKGFGTTTLTGVTPIGLVNAATPVYTTQVLIAVHTTETELHQVVATFDPIVLLDPKTKATISSEGLLGQLRDLQALGVLKVDAEEVLFDLVSN